MVGGLVADPDLIAGQPAGAGRPLYARIGVRFRALLIDDFVLFAAFLAAAWIGSRFEGVSGVGAALFGLWVALVVFYEPISVWRTGGTIGHHLQNICVVSEKTGGRPGLLAAAVRHLVKATLGSISFLMILASQRQQAIHDQLTGVTVRIKDPARARRRDYVRGRAGDDRPSAPR